MMCESCNNNVEQNYIYCPYCSEKLQRSNSKTEIIDAGSNNINIGLGNNSTQEIYIEQFNAPERNNEPIVEYVDRLEKVVYGGMDGFKRKFEVCGILSVISALVTIFDYLLTKSNFTLLLLMTTLGLLAYALDSKEKNKKLKDHGIVYRGKKPILTVEEDGKVYKIKKFGICPICEGRVFIYYDEKFKRKLGKCENNKDHLYTYDHTLDAGAPFIIFDLH
ncbi:hypothetical protein [Oceanobacillus sp. FSL W7-1309]|uniref:hypothetical protein n=1 Tax=Oceanobacillus sp. FSL W7-1309 TaxID=2954539 RepID=UPI0030F84BA6